jgi:hypothetical protein
MFAHSGLGIQRNEGSRKLKSNGSVLETSADDGEDILNRITGDKS